MAAGTWNIFGVNLPEFGITERLGLNSSAPATNNSNTPGLTSSSNLSNYSFTDQPAVTLDNFNPRLGATTTNNLQPQSYATAPAPSPTQQTPSGPDPLQQLRDNYINQLNSLYGSMESSLDPQRAAQEQAIQNQYNTATSNLGIEEQSAQAKLDNQERKVKENQIKNLRDLTDNMSNLFQAGNNYLGAMGAGDSSAANMYSYALSRLGTKQRSGIMADSSSKLNDIAEREAELGRTVVTAKNNLEAQRMDEMTNLATWFNQAKQQIAQGKGQNLAQLSNDLLQAGIAEIQNINAKYNALADGLNQWALNNSQNLAQLKQNLSAVSDPSRLGVLPQFTGLNAQMSANPVGTTSWSPGGAWGNDTDPLSKLLQGRA